MNLNDKMKAMLDRRAKEMATINKDAINFVKGILDDERVESLIVNQIENGRFEFAINFSVDGKGMVWCAGSHYNMRLKLENEKAHELTTNISKEIMKIIKEHGFSIIGAPIFEFQGAQQGRVCFKCKEEEK